MHIVLVHYLEVKVIPNPTLVHCTFSNEIHHPKCCNVQKNYVTFVL